MSGNTRSGITFGGRGGGGCQLERFVSFWFDFLFAHFSLETPNPQNGNWQIMQTYIRRKAASDQSLHCSQIF